MTKVLLHNVRDAKGVRWQGPYDQFAFRVHTAETQMRPALAIWLYREGDHTR